MVNVAMTTGNGENESLGLIESIETYSIVAARDLLFKEEFNPPFGMSTEGSSGQQGGKTPRGRHHYAGVNKRPVWALARAKGTQACKGCNIHSLIDW